MSTPLTSLAPAEAAAVRVRDLTKVYGNGDTAVRALDGISIDIARGQLTAIMGPSGSGKSTLMHCAAGLDTATAGRVWIGDTDITDLDDDALTRLRRTQVGFVFQSFNLLPTMTAYENIVLPLRLARARLDAAWVTRLTEVLGITERLHHRPSELSGGQQQRVAVARALATRSTVVFADEPTGALDSRASNDLLRFLRHSVTELGQTIVMVTHDERAAAHADRILRLTDGRIVEDRQVDRVA